MREATYHDLIHVDVQIEVYDAAGNPVREANGQVGTLGPNEDWGIFCRVLTTPTPVAPLPNVVTPTAPLEAIIEDPVLEPSPETEDVTPEVIEDIIPTVTPEAP